MNRDAKSVNAWTKQKNPEMCERSWKNQKRKYGQQNQEMHVRKPETHLETAKSVNACTEQQNLITHDSGAEKSGNLCPEQKHLGKHDFSNKSW